MSRPKVDDKGMPTRIQQQMWTEAEKAVYEALQAVERAGASLALTDAVVLLGKARDRVADHVEGHGNDEPKISGQAVIKLKLSRKWVMKGEISVEGKILPVYDYALHMERKHGKNHVLDLTLPHEAFELEWTND